MLHCSHQQYYTEYSDKTTTTTFTHSNIIVISAWSLCTRSAPFCLWSSNIGLLRHGETSLGRIVDPVLWFVRSGWLLQGSLSSDRRGRGGWRGGGVLRGVQLAQRTGAAEAAAQRPPVLLALPTQPPADPRSDLVPALQQEVHQLHIRSGGDVHTKKTCSCVRPTFNTDFSSFLKIVVSQLL